LIDVVAQAHGILTRQSPSLAGSFIYYLQHRRVDCGTRAVVAPDLEHQHSIGALVVTDLH
jgi:hypothetical protein